VHLSPVIVNRLWISEVPLRYWLARPAISSQTHLEPFSRLL